MADFDIKEIELLNTYKKKLRNYKNVSLEICAHVERRIREIRKDLEYISKDINNIEEKSSEATHKLEKRYSRVISEFGNSARSKVGQSDVEVQHKIELLSMQTRSLQRSIKELIVKMENTGQRTKNFGLQMSSLTDMCSNVIDQKTEFIDKYISLASNAQVLFNNANNSVVSDSHAIKYKAAKHSISNKIVFKGLISKGLYIKCSAYATFLTCEFECVNYNGDFWLGKEDTYIEDFVSCERFEALSCMVPLCKDNVKLINKENGIYKLIMVFSPIDKETKYIRIHNLCSWLDLEEELFVLSKLDKEEKIM